MESTTPANSSTDSQKMKSRKFIPKPKLRRLPPEYIDFQKYIEENCENKVSILEREAFHQIKRPIIIIFNHFRELCAYHTKWLDELYRMALQFRDDIEFIAADLMDIDILYSGRNPLSFFSRVLRPENQKALIYALDEKKRIHELSYYGEQDLLDLCEKLLNGSLFPSQSLPENNEKSLIKICVQNNYEDLVLNSSKNIFLIVDLEKNRQVLKNYENLALDLKDYNLDIVYMEAEKNYIPFEYYIISYPTILFIPHNDKKNFVYYEGFQTEVDFLKKVLNQPEYLKSLQLEQINKMQSKSVEVPNDFKLDFKKMPQFLKEKYHGSFEILNREILEKSKRLILIVFMNFQGKCLAEHIKWLNLLNQMAEKSSFKFFIADFEDIDVINSRYYPEVMISSCQGKPKIYAFDRLNHSYKFGKFESISSLYYFADKIEHGDLYYSQVYTLEMEQELVKTWTADNFHTSLHKTKKNIFITFYSSNDKNSENLFKLLDIIAGEVKELNVDLVKFDVKLNYVDLEYAQPNYPVHYFIPQRNKRNSRFYVVEELNRNGAVDFIKSNIKKVDPLLNT